MVPGLTLIGKLIDLFKCDLFSQKCSSLRRHDFWREKAHESYLYVCLLAKQPEKAQLVSVVALGTARTREKVPPKVPPKTNLGLNRKTFGINELTSQ